MTYVMSLGQSDICNVTEQSVFRTECLLDRVTYVMSLGQSDICSISCYSTVVFFHGHEDEATVAPVTRPAILHEPVGLVIQYPITHRKYRVVQVIGPVFCRKTEI